MYNRPSIDDLLDAVSISLQNDILPELASEKAQLAVVLAQSMLQQVKQIVPVQQQLMVLEHNEMVAAFRDIGAIVGETPGPEADRIRARARDLGTLPELAPLPGFAELQATYLRLSEEVVATLDDLDALIRRGEAAAGQALLRLREHLGPRTAREFATYTVGAGMAGRG